MVMKRSIAFFWVAVGTIVMWACTSNPQTYSSPDGYNLSAPEKMIMKESLLEISGITWHKDDTFLALNDEEGKIFFIHWMGTDNTIINFKQEGDFEDVTKYKQWIFTLRSDGSIYSLPDSTTIPTKARKVVKELPKGNYESLYADEEEGKLYVLCKKCKDKKSEEAVISGYVMELSGDNVLNRSPVEIDLSSFAQEKPGEEKKGFFPSAMTFNRSTNEWYIISSVNLALLVADKNLKAKELYDLNPDFFNQPEGIMFDRENNLYISNEGDELQNGNVLKFAFRKKTGQL